MCRKLIKPKVNISIILKKTSTFHIPLTHHRGLVFRSGLVSTGPELVILLLLSDTLPAGLGFPGQFAPGSLLITA